MDRARAHADIAIISARWGAGDGWAAMRAQLLDVTPRFGAGRTSMVPTPVRRSSTRGAPVCIRELIERPKNPLSMRHRKRARSFGNCMRASIRSRYLCALRGSFATSKATP